MCDLDCWKQILDGRQKIKAALKYRYDEGFVVSKPSNPMFNSEMHIFP